MNRRRSELLFFLFFHSFVSFVVSRAFVPQQQQHSRSKQFVRINSRYAYICRTDSQTDFCFIFHCRFQKSLFAALLGLFLLLLLLLVPENLKSGGLCVYMYMHRYHIYQVLVVSISLSIYLSMSLFVLFCSASFFSLYRCADDDT